MTLDRIPVKDLPGQYNIGKTALYDRFKKLGIVPQRDGHQSFITSADLALLNGESSPERSAELSEQTFKLKRAPSELSERLPERSEAELSLQTLMLLMEAVASRLAAPDPLSNLRALQTAYEHGWQLSSAQLAPLVGRKKLSGREFERFGFRFERVGREWRVEKVRG